MEDLQNYTTSTEPDMGLDPGIDDTSAEHIRDSLYLFVYALTGIVALIGNSIVVNVVFTVKKMRTFVHILLANMAISDISCAVTFFLGLFLCSEYFMDHLGAGNGYCVANKTIQLLSFQVSSVTMTFVAVDRWLAVFYPFTNGKNPVSANKVVVGVWLMAFAIIVVTSPSLGYQKYFNEDGMLIKCGLAKAFDIFGAGNNPKYQRAQLISANLLHFWIPFTVICVAYGSISIKVSRRKLGDDVTKSQADLLIIQRWKTIKMLIAAVCVFMLCWIPFFIFNIIAFMSDSSKKRPCNQSVMFLVVIWMAFSSCCCNPVVYWLYNENYRHGIASFFKVITFREKEWPSKFWPSSWRKTGRGSTEPIHASI